MGPVIKILKETALVKPKIKTKGKKEVNQMIVDDATKSFVKKRDQHRNYCQKIYSVVFDQSSDAMKAKIMELDNWDEITDKSNSIDLLKAIRGAT